jgi:hypothetical protein
MGAPVQISSLHRFEGAYRIASVSGVISGVAAATATAGFLWTIRWAPTVVGATGNIRYALIQRLRARMVTIHGPTATQELGIDLIFARSYSASCTGGTSATMTTNNAKKRTSFPTSQVTDIQVANTGALTAGTHTLDAQALAQCSTSEVAFSATVQAKDSIEVNLTTQDMEEYPLVLAPNEGLILRNTVAQGAGYTGRVVVELDWREAIRV